MATPAHVSRRTFLTALKRSGLVSREDYLHAKALVPDSDRGRLLARALVEAGLLTRFQAERLLVGRVHGFQLDQYVILEEIGRGGMGRVYKARHRTMNRTVALKILAPDLTRSPRAQEMFLREVRAVAQLVHPNLVTAFDANKVGDRYYLVLEYVDGPNLDQLVRSRGPLEVGQACDFIRQAAQGLQCAHIAGMIHRDIKPANILVQRRAADGSPGLVKVSDFGLARLGDPDKSNNTILTKPNTVMGTPDFLSPEQARCMHRTDIRSDLYSLGCTFYYLLTGTVPFPNGTPVEKLVRHTMEEPTPVGELSPAVPPEVAGIVRKLMAKKAEDRYQTPAEAVAALEPFSVSGPTPWEPARPEPLSLQDEITPPADDSDPVLSAIESTMPPAAGLTPLADSSLLRGVRRRRRSLSLFWAVVLSFLLGGALAALYFYLLQETGSECFRFTLARRVPQVWIAPD